MAIAAMFSWRRCSLVVLGMGTIQALCASAQASAIEVITAPGQLSFRLALWLNFLTTLDVFPTTLPQFARST